MRGHPPGSELPTGWCWNSGPEAWEFSIAPKHTGAQAQIGERGAKVGARQTPALPMNLIVVSRSHSPASFLASNILKGLQVWMLWAIKVEPESQAQGFKAVWQGLDTVHQLRIQRQQLNSLAV